jgi:hypothetical protein
MMSLNEALSEELAEMKKHTDEAAASTTDLASIRQEIESLRSGYAEVGGPAALRRMRLWRPGGVDTHRVFVHRIHTSSQAMRSSGAHERRRWHAVFARHRTASVIENAVTDPLQPASP